ncbi:hypothetical protein [Xenophilus sp.]
MATACPSCGQRNRDKALRCARCGAPLGAEPTAAAMPAAPESGVPDWRADAADDPRAGDGRARDRRAASGTGMAWLPWAIAGIAAAVAGYVVLNRPAPAPSAGEEAPAAVAAPSPAPAAAPAAAVPAPAPVEPSQAKAAPPPAPREADRAVAPARPRNVRREPPPETRAAAAPRRASPREEAAPVPSAPPPGDAMAPADSPWVSPPPAREATNTAAPGYRDAGPPVVIGPGPRVMPPAFAESDDPRAPAVRGDPGPPPAAGPGPRYDFGSPGAARR